MTVSYSPWIQAPSHYFNWFRNLGTVATNISVEDALAGLPNNIGMTYDPEWEKITHPNPATTPLGFRWFPGNYASPADTVQCVSFCKGSPLDAHVHPWNDVAVSLMKTLTTHNVEGLDNRSAPNVNNTSSPQGAFPPPITFLSQDVTQGHSPLNFGGEMTLGSFYQWLNGVTGFPFIPDDLSHVTLAHSYHYATYHFLPRRLLNYLPVSFDTNPLTRPAIQPLNAVGIEYENGGYGEWEAFWVRFEGDMGSQAMDPSGTLNPTPGNVGYKAYVLPSSLYGVEFFRTDFLHSPAGENDTAFFPTVTINEALTPSVVQSLPLVLDDSDLPNLFPDMPPILFGHGVVVSGSGSIVVGPEEVVLLPVGPYDVTEHVTDGPWNDSVQIAFALLPQDLVNNDWPDPRTSGFNIDLGTDNPWFDRTGSITPFVEFTIKPARYRWIFDETPPLRQKQRGDELAANSPRPVGSPVGPRSWQESIRQGWGNTYP